MFENLSDKLQRAFKNLRGQGTVTEENIGDALREIRVALLEADVNLNVVKELIEHIREKAVGQQVMTALSPTEQVIKIVRDELVALLGKDTARFNFASRAAHRHPDGRPAGLGQNHHLRQAGSVAQKGRPPPDAGLGRRLPPRRPRAAQDRRQRIKANIYEGDTEGRGTAARRWWSAWPKRRGAKRSIRAATCSSSIPPAVCTSTKI